MQKRIGLTLWLVLFLLVVQAQPKLNYQEADSVSYALYMEGKWNELIDYSKEVRRQGFDFFYLQARTGIAYYQLKKYRKASEWFLKAWESDQSFGWLQEYLYYSLLWGGRSIEAYKAAAEFSPEIQEKIGYSVKKITRAGIEAGYSFNPDYNALVEATHDLDAGVGSADDYGEAFYLKNYHFESLDLSHRITPGFSMNHNFTYVGMNREQRVDWGGRNLFGTKTNQFQYVVNPNMVLGKKIYLSPSMSLIWGNFSYLSGGISGTRRYFGDAVVHYRDQVFSIAAWSHAGNFSPGFELNYANINDSGFGQYSAWVTVYPGSNLNLYLTPRIYFKHSDEIDFGINTLGISGGFQAGPLHFYGQYLKGDMENFIEAGGYIVSNFPGTSEQKFSGSVYFPVGKNYQFVVRYIYQDVTETYRLYQNLAEANAVNYSYVKNTLTVGISWNF
jgi:hypothetical protein